MKKVFFLHVLLLAAMMLHAEERNLLCGTRTPEEVAKCILTNQQWVPYPDYEDRKAWDAFLGNQKGELIRRGEKQLTYQWRINVATDYLAYERTGERKIMESVQSANNNALCDLVLAELAEGEGRFLDQIINGVWMECERTSWVLSAHLFRQPSGRSLPDHRTQIVDLGSGEVGGLLAWTYYFLHEQMDSIHPVISIRLKENLQQKIIEPYFANEREWWLAMHLKENQIVNNWNPWCNFNVLQVLMLIEEDPQRVAAGVWRSMQSVDKFLNYVKGDGACEEGPSYWGHAAGKLFDYLDLLYAITDGEISLFDHPLVRDMGEYVMKSYVADGWVVNFADASARYSDNLSCLMYRYGKATGSSNLCHFASYLAKDRKRIITGGSDIYRALAGLGVHDELRQTTPATFSETATWYPQTQFCYFREGAWMLACKGGHNNESHNHNDIGTFSLYYHGAPLLIDVGVGTYTKQTFSSERYSIWTMQSAYHNLPTINGYMQHEGADYQCNSVDYQPKKKSIRFDIAGAYPKEAGVQKWLRSYQLKKNELVITDRFVLEKEPQTPTCLHFLTKAEPVIDAPSGSIHIAEATLSFSPQLFDAQCEPILLEDNRLSNVWGEQLYRITLISKDPSCRNYTVRIY